MAQHRQRIVHPAERRAPAYCLLLFLLLLSVRRAPAQAVADWGIDNPRVPWGQGAEGVAADGACYGMVRAKLEFHRLGLDKVPGHSFTELTTPAKDALTGQEKPGERLFMEQVAAMAQRYALRTRDFEREVYSKTANPLEVDHSLVGHGVSADNPQILILSNKHAYDHDRADATIPTANKTPRVAHAVLVEGREETDTAIRYLVSDPNSPRDANGNRQLREIVYDKNTESYTGLGGYDAIQHDTSVLPEQNRRWLDALLQGATLPEKLRYIPPWHGVNEMPLQPDEYLKMRQMGKEKQIIVPPVPSESLNKKMSALDPDAVGGVRLYFDPTLVTDERNAPARWQMIGALTEQLSAGRENFLLQAGGAQQMKAVRLSAILRDAADAPDATLGDLTRLTGFALNRKTGEVYLLGRTEPDHKAIPLQILSVALQTVWKQGLTPAISLDPDPDDFAGPQHVRIEQVPEAYQHSTFVQTMLEADYAMKRILLADDILDIAGYRSHYDLLTEHPTAQVAENSRFWLSPKETAGAEVYEAKAGELTVWYFDSDICVLTEAMKRAQDALVGAGLRDPLSENAAHLFTEYYDRIEEQRPIFQQLHGLFDAAKLAAVLKARGVVSAQLDAVAAREVTPVELKDSYPGIGPKVISSTEGEMTRFLYLSGGVLTRADLAGTDFIAADETLAPAASSLSNEAAGDEVSFSVQLPDTLPLDPKSTLHVDSELETNAALDELVTGDWRQAHDRINRLFASGQVSDIRPYVARAWALMIEGNYAAALKDADTAVAGEPVWRALRGRIRLLAGDRTGAIADVRAADVAYPHNSVVLMQKVWVLIHAGKWTEVDGDLAQLMKMMPGDPDIENVRRELRLLHHLDPVDAAVYVHAILSIPFTLALDLAHVKDLLVQGEGQQARDDMQEILSRPALQQAPAQDTLFLLEHCWVAFVTLEAKLGTPEAMRSALDYLDRLSLRRPSWPSALLLRNDIDALAPLAEQIARYEKAYAMPADADPLLREMQVQHGVDLRVVEGYLLAMRASQQLSEDETVQTATVRAVFDRVIARMPEGLAKHVLVMTRKSIYLLEVARGEKQTDKAALEHFNAQLDDEFLTLPTLPALPHNIDLQAVQGIYLPFLKHDCAQAFTAEDESKVDRLFKLVLSGLNVGWSSVDDLESAARMSLLAHSSYADYLAARLGRLPAVTAAAEALKQDDADPDAALNTLDSMVDKLLASLGDLPPCTKALLRASLFADYPKLLQQAGVDDINTRVVHREQAYVKQLSATPTTLVEYRTLSLWFEEHGNALASRGLATELLAEMMRDYHRDSVRLREQFYDRASRLP